MNILYDPKDADILTAYKWYLHCGYARAQESRTEARINGRRSRKWIHFSRIILERKLNRELSSWEQCDHINGNRLDNRRINLRACSISENAKHKVRLNKRNKTGQRGILINKECTKHPYIAQICINYKKYYIGSFASLDEAVKARDIFRKKHLLSP